MMLFTFVMNGKFQTIVGQDSAYITTHGIVLEIQEEITGTPCAFRDIDFSPGEVGEGINGGDLIDSANAFYGSHIKSVNVQKVTRCFGFNRIFLSSCVFSLIGIPGHNRGILGFYISGFLMVQSMALERIINGGFTYPDTTESQFIRDSLWSSRWMLSGEFQDKFLYFFRNLTRLFTGRSRFISQCQLPALQKAVKPFVKSSMAYLKLTSEIWNG